MYADDLICIAQAVPALNRKLEAIGREGAKYGFRLNKAKCEYLSFGNAGPVRFAGGQQVERQQEIKHMGCMLNARGDPGEEIAHRITECMIILQRMHIFWRHGSNLVDIIVRFSHHMHARKPLCVPSKIECASSGLVLTSAI